MAKNASQDSFHDDLATVKDLLREGLTLSNFREMIFETRSLLRGALGLRECYDIVCNIAREKGIDPPL